MITSGNMGKKAIVFVVVIMILLTCFVIYLNAETIIQKKHFIQTEQAAKQIVNAIKQYNNKNSEYPEKLDDLVPEFLPEIEKPKWGDSGWIYVNSETGFFFQVGFHFLEGDRLYPSLYYTTSNGWYHDG